MGTLCRRLAPSVFLAILVAVTPADAVPKGEYRLALIRVTYPGTSPRYSITQVRDAAKEIEDFYANLSNFNLTLKISVATIGTSPLHDKAYYFNPCKKDGTETRSPCPPPLIEDVAQIAAIGGGGIDFTKIDGITVLSSFEASSLASDVTFDPITIDRPKVKGTFQRSYDYESPPEDPTWAAPGPSKVYWGPWAHELGHQLELWDGVVLKDSKWNGHPSQYASGYDLMDSCYPCGAGAYSILDTKFMTGAKRVFNGWLPGDKVITIAAPPTGTDSTTVHLRALAASPYTSFLNQVIKLPITATNYYLIESRKRVETDAVWAAPGIWDEGVRITRIDETGDPPVQNVYTCDTLVAGGCDTGCDVTGTICDPRHVNCLKNSKGAKAKSAAEVPAYCWRVPLFHPADAWADSANNITMKVNSGFSDGYTVEIVRGPPLTYPDMIIPPRPLPHGFDVFRFAGIPTQAIWVDSSCNGYESEVGAAGLRWGRALTARSAGGGDDPCADHENRLYALVRNAGTAAAAHVRVRFSVGDPHRVRFPGCDQCANLNGAAWTPVALVDEETFPRLAQLAPGESTTVWTAWTPQSPVNGPANLLTAVRAEIDPVADELSVGNNVAEIAFQRIEVPALPNRRPVVPNQSVEIENGDADDRTFYLAGKAKLPPGCRAQIAGGLEHQAVTLAGQETLPVPLAFNCTSGVPVSHANIFYADVQTLAFLHNAFGTDGDHSEMASIGGVLIALQGVRRAQLSLSILEQGQVAMTLGGRITPPHPNAIVAIDYMDPQGQVVTRRVRCDGAGSFRDVFQSNGPGFRARALWVGDLDHQGAASAEVPLP